MECRRNDQSLTSTSANYVFRSGVNKAEQDLPVKHKSNANEGFNSTVKRKNVVSEVAGLKKEARKHRND